MVGLLSVLDALTDLPMNQIVAELPLAPDIREALCQTDANSPCALTLRHTLAIESCDWAGARKILGETSATTYIDAVAWAMEEQLLLAQTGTRRALDAA